MNFAERIQILRKKNINKTLEKVGLWNDFTPFFYPIFIFEIVLQS